MASTDSSTLLDQPRSESVDSFCGILPGLDTLPKQFIRTRVQHPYIDYLLPSQKASKYLTPIAADGQRDFDLQNYQKTFAMTACEALVTVVGDRGQEFDHARILNVFVCFANPLTGTRLCQL